MCDLDEAGFAPTLTTCYSWFPIGERLQVPYEASQGRRVNAVGAYFSHGPEADRFVFETYASLPISRAKKARKSLAETALEHGVLPEEVGPIDAERLHAFLWKVAGKPANAPLDWKRERPLYIVLDNYSVHKSQTIKEALPALEAADVHLFYLPSYSPQLSEIEPLWHDTKHHRMTKRSFQTAGELKRAVDAALKDKAQQLLGPRAKTEMLLQRAA